MKRLRKLGGGCYGLVANRYTKAAKGFLITTTGRERVERKDDGLGLSLIYLCGWFRIAQNNHAGLFLYWLTYAILSSLNAD
jgi:hypothetical protein